MDLLFTFKYQLYLLQLEEYDLKRYWKLLFKKGFFGYKKELRKNIVWTKKAEAILFLSIVILCFFSFLLSKINFYLVFLPFIFSPVLMPIFYTIALTLLFPIDKIAKSLIINKAKNIILKNKHIKIIGIAGSYGKTTMKAVLYEILSTKYKVLATPENINTPIGISRFIIDNKSKMADILILEMGEYYKGDIKYICNIAHPDIAVITGINEAHFERLRSIKRTTETIFEIAQNSKPEGIVLMNADDNNVLNNYKKYTFGKNTVFYSSNNREKANIKINDKKFDAEKLKWIFSTKEIGDVEVSALGEYIIGDIAGAIWIALSLGLNEEQIKKGIFKIKPGPHRLSPIKANNGVLVIDDSYNGNPEGVEEALKVLARFTGKRKIVLTPGLVETGKKNKEIHVKIGESLAKTADMVILIKNSATPFIEQGLLGNGFSKENIKFFDTAQQAHNSLSKILKPNDVILFQNDWSDQYI